MSRTQQFRLLLWKNFVLQKRHKLVTAVEFLLPVVLILLLVFIRKIAPYDTFAEPFVYNDFSIDRLPSTMSKRQILQQLSLLFGNMEGGRRALPVAFAPNSSDAVNDIMDKVAKRLGYENSGVGFHTEEELEKFAMYGTMDILAGVTFPNVQKNNTFPKDIQYKIRMKVKSNGTASPLMFADSWFTEQTYPTYQMPGPRELFSNEGGKPGYYSEGYLALQHAIAVSIIEFLTKTEVDVQVKMRRFPYPPFVDDKFLMALQEWLPLMILLSFLYPAINLVKCIVHEKENKIKESMKMMGLSGWLHWVAWFVKTISFYLPTSALIVALLSLPNSDGLAVLTKSNPILVFMYLAIYNITSICFCNFISTLFSKASSAATASGLFWFLTFVPFFFMAPRYDSLTYNTKIWSCFLSNTAMSLGAQLITMHEGTGAGIQWHNLFHTVTPGDGLTLGMVLILMLFDSIIYSLFTWYVETVFPGEFGVPQPWYFPFMKEYWTKSIKSDEICDDLLNKKIYNPEFFEKDPTDLEAGIQIKDLCKVYNKVKVAVNHVSLNMFEGQITVLLGHNGAGKTTTMSTITGLIPPTQGTAVISGYDCRENMAAIRKSLGLCPQHDVLFDDLTVAEHLYFYCKLKGCENDVVQTETNRLLKALLLDDKRHALAKTLSGGMKRKLSVGIALCGGSKVVMLDEPTSGMDPSARRNTWDLLQNERQGRTILLTTHFMDEADLLGDRIAIMAHGQLQCTGSSLFLKKKYGAGYHMVIVKQSNCNADTITDLVLQWLPTAELESNIGAELSYILPHEEASKFESLFATLEEQKDELGISSYGASVTTMEEVFLRVGESNDGEGVRGMLHSKANGNGKLIDLNDGDFTSPSSNIIMEGATEKLINQRIQRNEGVYLYCQQFWAMLLKRILYTQRNWILTLCQMLVPVIFVTLSNLVAQSLPSNENPKPMTFSLSPFFETVIPYYMTKPAAEDSTTIRLAQFYRNQFRGENYPVDVSNMMKYKNMSDYLLQKSYEDLPHFNLHQIAAISFLRNVVTHKSMMIAHFNNQPFHGPPISLWLVDNALLKYYTNDSDYRFSVINHPFALSVSDTMLAVFNGNLGFNIAFNLVFGIAFVVSSFAIFIIRENNSKSRHLQFVSGVNFVIFWVTTFIWDFLNFLFPCYMILFVFIAFNQEGYTDPLQQSRFMLVFVLYAWSTLPLMYLLSFLFKVPATGFTRLMMFNVFTGIATFLTVTILSIPQLGLKDWAEFLDWIFLSLPSYCLGWACYDLYKNYHINRMCSYKMVKPFCELAKITKNCGSYPCPEYQENFLSWKRPGIGRMLVLLIIQGFFFWFVMVLMEMQVLRKGKRWIKHLILSFRHRHSRRLRSSKARCKRKLSPPPSCVLSVNGRLYIKLSQEAPGDNSDQELCVLDAADGEVEQDSDLTLEDDDVTNERDRIDSMVMGGLKPTDNLVLKNITKLYDDILAVDHISVGIPRGECFGLLGINGAGKTTTFKMMTGDETVSEGDAFVEGFSVTKHLKQVQQRIGYCPQFDALIDQMTGRETLYMFARLHGVYESQIADLVSNLADNMLLNEHLDKMVKEYSGGNKRKLSTAISLVGSPPIVFLDEPTTGMDPLARRLLWDAISRIRDRGHSIVLTSHSMEECDVLCTRLAIMVNGRFRCLGSPQHLKNKFGQGYTLIAKIHRQDEGANTKVTDASLQRLRNFIESSFPGSILKDTHHGMVHYHIQNPKLTWAYVFGTIEKAKSKYHIEDYSVSQTTLEQVFLNFARAQRQTDQT